MEAFSQLVERAGLAFSQATTPAELEDAKAVFLGKNGELTAQMKLLGSLPTQQEHSFEVE